MKQKKISARSHQLKRCLIETESNLNKIGIQVMPQLTLRSSQANVNKKNETHNQNKSTIYVRDAVESSSNVGGKIKLVNQKAYPESSTKMPAVSNKITSTVTTTATQCQSQLEEQHTTNDDQIFHPYDSLHLKADSISSKRHLAEKLGKMNFRTPDGHINLAFLNDYDYFNNERIANR